MAHGNRREADSSSKLDRASGSTIDIGRGSGDRYHDYDEDEYYYERRPPPPKVLRRRSSSFRNELDRWDRDRFDYDRRRHRDRERARERDEYYSSDDDKPVHVRRRSDEPYHQDYRAPPRSHRRDYYDPQHRSRRQPSFLREPVPEQEGPIIVRRKPSEPPDDSRQAAGPLSVEEIVRDFPPPGYRSPPEVVIRRREVSLPRSNHMPGLFQTLYDVGDPQDVTVHLELPIVDSFDDDLEEFAQLRRMGHFKPAKDYFKEHLESNINHPYVFVHYAELLLDMGDYNAFDLLNPEPIFGLERSPPDVNKTMPRPRRFPAFPRRRRPRSGSRSTSSTISRSISPPAPPPPHATAIRQNDRSMPPPIVRERRARRDSYDSYNGEARGARGEREREEIIIRERRPERSLSPIQRSGLRENEQRRRSVSPPPRVVVEERRWARSLSRSRSRSRSRSLSAGDDYDEMYLLRWNWRLLKAMSIIRRKGTIQEALDEAIAALDELEFGPRMGSTEIQIVALALKIFAHVRLFLPRIYDKEIYGYAEEWVNWPALYRNLLAQGRIWDFRDIFTAGFSAFGSEQVCQEFFGTQNCRDQIIQDWVNDDDYDESTVLAHLDILMYMILEVELTRDNLTSMGASLNDAKALAERIQHLHPEAMKTRPFLRWIIAKSAEARCKEDNNLADTFRELFEYLGNFSGLAFYRREWIKLPVYIPQADEDPRWTIPDLPPEANVPVLMALKVAKQLQDYPTQVMCYKLLILGSQNPRKYFDELAHLQKTVQGDMESHLHSSLSRYLICKDRDERSKLLSEIKESQDWTQDWTQEGVLRDPEIYWARDFIQRALTRQLEGRNSTAPLRESPQAFFKYLPEHVQHFIRQNAGPGIVVPPPPPSRNPKKGPGDDDLDPYGAPRRPGPPGPPGPPPPAAPSRPNAIQSQQNSWMNDRPVSMPPPPPPSGPFRQINSSSNPIVPRRHQLPPPESSQIGNENGTPIRRAPKAVGFKEPIPDAESQSATSYISEDESNADNFRLRFPDGLKFNIDDKDMSDNATITLTIQDDKKPGEETVVNWKREDGFVSHSIHRKQRDRRNSASADGSQPREGSQASSRHSSQDANTTRDVVLFQGGYWDQWSPRHNVTEPAQDSYFHDTTRDFYGDPSSSPLIEAAAYNEDYYRERTNPREDGQQAETRFTWLGDQGGADEDRAQIPQQSPRFDGPSYPPPPDYLSHQAQLQRDREALELERQRFQLEREKFELEKQRREVKELQVAAEAQLKERELAARKAKEREEELHKREIEIAKLKAKAEMDALEAEKTAGTEAGQAFRRETDVRGKLFTERDANGEYDPRPPPPKSFVEDYLWDFGPRKGKKRKGKLASQERRLRAEEQAPDSSDFPGVEGPSTRYDRTTSPTRGASKGPRNRGTGADEPLDQAEEWYSWNSTSSRHHRKKSKALDPSEADRLRERMIDSDLDLPLEPVAADKSKDKPKGARIPVPLSAEPPRSHDEENGRVEHVASRVPGISRHKVKNPTTTTAYFSGEPEGIEAEPEILDDEWETSMRKPGKRNTATSQDPKPTEVTRSAPITDKEEADILQNFDSFKLSKKEKWHEVQETAAQNERIAKRPPISRSSRDSASAPAEANKPSGLEKEKGDGDPWVELAEREQVRQARRSSTGDTPTYAVDLEPASVWDQGDDVRKKAWKKGITRRESYREPYNDLTGRAYVPPVSRKPNDAKQGDRRLTRREKVEGSMRSQAQIDEDGRRHIRVRLEEPRLATDSDSAGELGSREAHGRVSRPRSRSRRPPGEIKTQAPTSAPSQGQEERDDAIGKPVSIAKPEPPNVAGPSRQRSLEDDLDEAARRAEAELEAIRKRQKELSPKKATVADPGPGELDSDEELPSKRNGKAAAVTTSKPDPLEPPPEPGISRKPTVTDAESSDD